MSSDSVTFASHRPFCDSVCDTLLKIGKIRGPPQVLTVGDTVHILVRAEESTKQGAKTQENRKALQQHLRKLTTLAIATMTLD